jgi:hypothetical protein
MLYKPDWPQAQERFLAWWEGEVLDRPCLSVTAPRRPPGALGKPRREIPLPPPEQYWTDPDYLIASEEANCEATWFGGEAFPCRTLLIGYAYLDAEPVFKYETIWSTARLERWEDCPRPPLGPEMKRWAKTLEIVEAFAAAGEGKWFCSIPTIGTASDALSLLRTPGQLCLDLLDCPDQVYAARDQLTDLWFDCYEQCHQIIQRHMTGSTSWLPLWSPGRSYTLQSDFSCMIGPRLFADFVAPHLARETAFLDHALYHLDGPGAIQHLDAVLDVPGMRGIQWVAGAGQPGPLEWPQVLHRVQERGKLLHISIEAKEVERALEMLRPEGLFLATWCNSIEEGQALLDLARKR